MPPSRLGQFGLWLQKRQSRSTVAGGFILPEGQGPLLAIFASSEMQNATGLFLDSLNDQRPELRFLDMNADGCPSPSTDRHACRHAFTREKPFAVLLLGVDLPSALITVSAEMGIPVIAANMRAETGETGLSLRMAVRKELLGCLTLVLTPDAQSRDSLRKLGVSANRIRQIGPFSQTYEPLPYNEAERSVIAEMFHGRHSWFAVSVPPEEEEIVLAAHHAALRQSHLALLIILPSDPSRIDRLAHEIEASGLVVARRDHDEEPTEEVQVYLIDSPSELGLWYRLAPVSFMGGTLSGNDQHSRHPFEPAALGSAIVHGPKIRRFSDAWQQLRNASATRALTNDKEIVAAAAELSQPDLVAGLANAAWNVSTGGAAVTIEIANTVLSYLERAKV